MGLGTPSPTLPPPRPRPSARPRPPPSSAPSPSRLLPSPPCFSKHETLGTLTDPLVEFLRIPPFWDLALLAGKQLTNRVWQRRSAGTYALMKVGASRWLNASAVTSAGRDLQHLVKFHVPKGHVLQLGYPWPPCPCAVR